ncbi:hypothetical protein [Geomonas subterranea]|uniref:hypothetical protein n=1 Tax=Geomonas subterranea TaxID=2847989 RepID=UPI001CD1DCF4|nr:hypothetical protein [Geomonas fuzhouensis]
MIQDKKLNCKELVEGVRKQMCNDNKDDINVSYQDLLFDEFEHFEDGETLCELICEVISADLSHFAINQLSILENKIKNQTITQEDIKSSIEFLSDVSEADRRVPKFGLSKYKT